MSKAKDFYQILGLTQSASLDEIKRAYKRLAMKLHPDRHSQSDKKQDAECKFKEVQEAYSVLSDSEKRQMYDQLGPQGYHQYGQQAQGFNPREGFSSFFQSSGHGFADLFEGMFGGGRERSNSAHSPAGEGIQVRLRLSLEDIAAPQTRTLSFSARLPCSACQGKGSTSPERTQLCTTCRGQGQIHEAHGFFVQSVFCPKCEGLGKLLEKPCKSCQGTSLQLGQRQVSLSLPPGIESGAVLRKAGMGHAGAWGGPPGDLQVVIEVLPHPFFERQGLDLICQLPLPFSMGIVGGKSHVPILGGGSGVLTIPAGSLPNGSLRVRGKGLTTGRRKGDLICHLLFEWPQHLAADEIDALKNLEQQWMKRHGIEKLYPQSAAYLKRVGVKGSESPSPK